MPSHAAGIPLHVDQSGFAPFAQVLTAFFPKVVGRVFDLLLFDWDPWAIALEGMAITSISAVRPIP